MGRHLRAYSCRGLDSTTHQFPFIEVPYRVPRRPIGLRCRAVDTVGRGGWSFRARTLPRRRRRVCRPHQAARHRAAAAHHRARDVLRRPRHPAAGPRRRDRRRRRPVGRLGVDVQLRLRPRHRRADAPHATSRPAPAHRVGAVGAGVRDRAGGPVDRGARAVGQLALGRPVAGGQRVLRDRLHDGPQAAHHPEHRLGRAGRLLPGADRLDGRDRRARVDAGRALPRRLLLDAPAHVGAGPALPRGLRGRGRADAPRGRPGRRGRVARS